MKKTRNITTKTGKLLLVFGILFSQLSFPLSVLADEVSNEEQSEITDTANEEETEEIEELNNEEENTKKDVKQTKETIPQKTSIIVELINDKCIIKGELNKEVVKQDLSTQIQNFEKIIDENGNEIAEGQKLYSNYQIVTSDGKIYTIIILGDYNNNGYLDEEDGKQIFNLLKENLSEEEINDILDIVDINQDNKLNLLDATSTVFTDGIWDNTITPSDNLVGKIFVNDNQEEFLVGETIEVKYYIRGFEQDSLNGIEGNIEFDNNILELTNIKLENNEINLNNGKFAELLNDYSTDGILMTISFKTIATGSTSISLNNIVASLQGVAANLNNTLATTNINVLEYGKGGDSEEPTATVPVVKQETTKINVPTPTKNIVARLITLSTDNYIKELTIDGYEINFDKNTYEYSIKVNNNVDSLKLNIILNNEFASYYIEGNKDFKVGENIVNIIVKAENGSTRNYTIKVNKEDKKKVEKEDTKEKTSNSSKTVIIILIVLVIIGLIYVIFKDDEEDRKESNK